MTRTSGGLPVDRSKLGGCRDGETGVATTAVKGWNGPLVVRPILIIEVGLGYVLRRMPGASRPKGAARSGRAAPGQRAHALE